MTIILNNLEPEILEKLANLANTHGRTLTEEIKIILTQEVHKNMVKTPEDLGWSKGFFERTAVACADDPIFELDFFSC